MFAVKKSLLTMTLFWVIYSTNRCIHPCPSISETDPASHPYQIHKKHIYLCHLLVRQTEIHNRTKYITEEFISVFLSMKQTNLHFFIKYFWFIAGFRQVRKSTHKLNESFDLIQIHTFQHSNLQVGNFELLAERH